MSFESNHTAPHQRTSLFNYEWSRCESQDPEDLEEVKKINYDFGRTVEGDQERTIDPQLLSNPFSLTESGFHNMFATDVDETNLEQAFAFDRAPVPYSEYHAPGSAPASPYFSHSTGISLSAVPGHLQPYHAPSPLQYQLHRRSVSEPPAGLNAGNGHRYESIPSDIMPSFHRVGYEVGTGKPTKQPKKHVAKNMLRSGLMNRLEQPRVHKRRKGAQTSSQHLQAAPTSEPSAALYPSQQGGVMSTDWCAMQQFEPNGYMTSRVCTPTPSPERLICPSEPSTPVRRKYAKRAGKERTAISITISIPELRSLIREEVEEGINAVLGSRKREFDRSAGDKRKAEIESMSLDELLSVEKPSTSE